MVPPPPPPFEKASRAASQTFIIGAQHGLESVVLIQEDSYLFVPVFLIVDSPFFSTIVFF